MKHSVGTFYGLQALRFFAALFVVLFHIQEAIGLRTNYKIGQDSILAEIGVEVFFVISGFICLSA